jgi:hypothetical protein
MSISVPFLAHSERIFGDTLTFPTQAHDQLSSAQASGKTSLESNHYDLFSVRQSAKTK